MVGHLFTLEPADRRGACFSLTVIAPDRSDPTLSPPYPLINQVVAIGFAIRPDSCRASASEAPS